MEIADSGERVRVVPPDKVVECLAALTTLPRTWAERVPADPAALLTAEQLGELLQLSPRTLKDQAAAGGLSHHRFGKHYRFSRSDISAILRLTQQSEKPQRRRLNFA
ncbi:excisionase family DNA binding protein [Saccharothrix saharensis]|uniref:Excisionase family DNA binding protein n=1 Tax=Saccharothrix saharensis TaxID=571190 RepID=A0A543JP35_9PSEU|nr:helix-turn-helix domain-containing protein [Saccharothrix saharensis]TQM84524.1 excisionase family DNA binding protein [Saccharothrix saharensis]